MDWERLFDDNQIEYVTRGPNTRKGEVSIQCPFCGEDDPSQHLGISLHSDNWGCLRSQEHRGKSPLKLIRALLGCSSTQAKLIAGQYGAVDVAAFDSLSMGFDAPTALKTPPVAALLPPECRDIKASGPTFKFWRYLKERGFHDPEHLSVCYTIQCCLTGYWKDRIIIPFFEEQTLIGWQGRALGKPTTAARYLSSSEEVKKTIFNYDKLRAGGDILFICEGPFDAIKLDYYGQKYGARATCTFGVTLTPDQIDLLNSAGKRFKQVFLLFDTDAAALDATFNLIDWLAPCKPQIGTLPDGVKDAGELTQQQVKELVLCHKKASLT